MSRDATPLDVIEGRAAWCVVTGDALDLLPTLPAGALVTDPPYGIGWTRGTWRDDVKAYPDLMRWLAGEGARLGGWCFIFQAMPNCHLWHEWFPQGWRIFAACKNFAQIRPTGVWHSWDPVVFWNSGPNSGPNSGHINRDYHVGNVAGVFREESGHPCPRPVDTMFHIAQLAAARGGLIIDPFAGSGTTGVAAIRTGRRFIGIEIDPAYADIARDRCERAAMQPRLIPDAPPPRVETLALDFEAVAP